MSLDVPNSFPAAPSPTDPSPGEFQSPAAPASGGRRLSGSPTLDSGSSEAALELLAAVQAYKARSGRLFPTWSEVLEVVQSLGYTKSDGMARRASATAPR